MGNPALCAMAHHLQSKACDCRKVPIVGISPVPIGVDSTSREQLVWFLHCSPLWPCQHRFLSIIAGRSSGPDHRWSYFLSAWGKIYCRSLSSSVVSVSPVLSRDISSTAWFLISAEWMIEKHIIKTESVMHLLLCCIGKVEITSQHVMLLVKRICKPPISGVPAR